MTQAKEDTEFHVRLGKSASKKRVYIGNLTSSQDLEVRLVELLEGCGVNVAEKDISVVRGTSSSCFSLVACQDVDRAVRTLNGTLMDGRKLVVQREKKATVAKKGQFGGGWSRPSTGFHKPTSSEKVAPSPSIQVKKAESVCRADNQAGGSLEIDTSLLVSEKIGEIITAEIKAAEQDQSNGDALNAVIASTAAMSLFATMNEFDMENIDAYNNMDHQIPSLDVPFQEDSYDDNEHDDITLDDFRSKCHKPLSQLLVDYGEQDLDFMKRTPTEMPPEDIEPMVEKKTRGDYQNRLTLHGKAPVHVELTSFGYTHGAPSDIRNGWSHAHPLAAVDCRDLPEVPPYMQRQDGLSPAVKRALLNAGRDSEGDNKSKKGEVRRCADDMAHKIFSAVQDAIDHGNHGHGSPLRMIVYAGSDSGRHRSVLVCELAATSLRKLLRSNIDNRITQPISVGTRHRDIDRRPRDTRSVANRNARTKQKELDSD